MNTCKLKAAMTEARYTQRNLAKDMKMSVNALNFKINGKTPITIDEAVLLGKLLNLDNEKFNEIFLKKSS